jgi:hypothetical protein
MSFAPVPAHGDPTELTHRPFVLVYAVIAVWTASVLINAAARHAWAAALAASGLALVLVWPQTGMLGELPKFGWGWLYYGRDTTAGLPQAAAFLRASARPGDTLAAHGLRMVWVPTDLATELAALTGMPVYIARPYVHIAGGGRRREVVLQRYAALDSVGRESRPDEALARLRQLNIQWYVVAGEQGPPWDRERRRAVFAERKVAVYSTRP